MAKYFITGIAGFIGSSVARELVRQGHQVSGIDNLCTGKLENLAEVREHTHVTVGDIQNTALMRDLCAGQEYVLHQAALASVPRSVADPVASHESNANGTLSVLMAARGAGVRRVVYAASSSAYGDQPTQPKIETMCPQPLSPYAVQKLTGEFYMQSFSHVYGLETVCLRYFNIFGPRQAADSPYSGVIARFVHMMLAGETPTINGDGSTSRDFTFVENAVQANLRACAAPAEVATGRVFNVGTGGSHTLLDLYNELASILRFTRQPKFGPVRSGDVQHSLASIERSRAELGYQPAVSFRQGLETTAAWYVAEAARQQQLSLVSA